MPLPVHISGVIAIVATVYFALSAKKWDEDRRMTVLIWFIWSAAYCLGLLKVL